MSIRVRCLGLVATTALALPLSPARIDAQSLPNACAETIAPAYVLVAPANDAPSVAVDFKTIYIANRALPTLSLPPVKQTRVLVIDDAGGITEGGVLTNTTRDDLPYALQGFDAGSSPGTNTETFAYTWVPGLRASTHYTVALARLDEHDCVFARIGAFTTSRF